MGKVNVTKGGNLYQYRFEIAPQGELENLLTNQVSRQNRMLMLLGWKHLMNIWIQVKKFFLIHVINW